MGKHGFDQVHSTEGISERITLSLNTTKKGPITLSRISASFAQSPGEVRYSTRGVNPQQHAPSNARQDLGQSVSLFFKNETGGKWPTRWHRVPATQDHFTRGLCYDILYEAAERVWRKGEKDRGSPSLPHSRGSSWSLCQPNWTIFCCHSERNPKSAIHGKSYFSHGT